MSSLNIKPLGVVSAAIDGNRQQEKDFGFRFFLRPKIDLASSPQLTAWAAEAVSGAIQNEFSLTPTIKLPNDVQIDGRKIAGVLVEMRAQEKAAHLAIAGIGVNVNQSREDFPKELQSRAISWRWRLANKSIAKVLPSLSYESWIGLTVKNS